MSSKICGHFLIFTTVSLGIFLPFLSFLIWKNQIGTHMVVTNTSARVFHPWNRYLTAKYVCKLGNKYAEETGKGGYPFASEGIK